MTLHTAFRMERSIFNDLVVKVQNVWDADMGPHAHIASKQTSCSSGSPVTMKTRVAVTLRWLAGGNYWDICGLFGIARGLTLVHTSHMNPSPNLMHHLSVGSFFSEKGPLWPTIYAIDDALSHEIHFDVSLEACQKAASEFSVYSRGRLNHCVCAVDGLIIRTRKPNVMELGKYTSNYNFKLTRMP